jgi:hypothetical protein
MIELLCFVLTVLASPFKSKLRLEAENAGRLRAMGIRDKPTTPASPWQNGFVERLIGSISA